MLDISVFSRAILEGRPRPNLYIQFGRLPDMPVVVAGGSDVHVDQIEGKVVAASWLYQAGDLTVVAGLQSISQPDALYGAYNTITLRICLRRPCAMRRRAGAGGSVIETSPIIHSVGMLRFEGEAGIF